MQIQITNFLALHLTPILSLFPVLQDYKVTAYDAEFIIKGNVALLRCDISGNGKEYVFVTSWLRDDGLTISLNDNNGKYAVFPTGEFHVRHVDETDTLRKYRCQVHNKLSRETKLSDQWAKIIMTGHSTKWSSKVFSSLINRYNKCIVAKGTDTAGSDVVKSGRPIFDDFSNICGRISAITLANVVFQMVKRLWLIRIDK
ncbi:dscam17 [Trichonephila clavipes]|nr:dscam17 [Trichonephila clavipes]